MSRTNELSTIKKVKLIVAASPDEFGVEAAQIGDFIRGLNDCYLDRGIYFALTINGDAAALSDCDLAFFLFGAKADQAVTDFLDAALDGYKKNGKPKVVTYFKETDCQIATDQVGDLKVRLGKEPDFYYHTYSHIDTLKLGVLMNIKRLDLNGVDIRLENGKAWQGGDALLDLGNVEMVSGYEDLERLKTERAALESGFYDAMTKYAENPEDAALYDAYIEASNTRNQAIQNVRDIESRLYHMLEGMYEQTSTGRISKRQAESYKLIERGKLSEARMVLNFDAIVSESRHDEEIADQTARRAQVHVNELLQLKDVNAALQDWEGVNECFVEAVKLEEIYNLPRVAMPAFVKHLHGQTMYTEAVVVAEKLLAWYLTPDSKYQPTDKGALYVMLGSLYGLTQRTEDAETKYGEALELFTELASAEQGRHRAELASTYCELGNYYYLLSRALDAEKNIKSSIDIWSVLMIQDPGLYDLEAAKAYYYLGIIYFDMSRMQESIDMINTAIEIYAQMFEKDSNDDIRSSLAKCYSGFGYILSFMHRASEAEDALDVANTHYEYLAERNPDAYEPRLALLTRYFSGLYRNSMQLAKQELSVKKGIDMLTKLAKRSPKIYERELAEAYNDLGALYTNSGRLAEAEYMYNTALVILQRLNANEPGVREDLLALCYMNLGRDYTDTGRLKEADEFLSDAVAIYRRLASDDPEVHAPFLAINLFYIGKLLVSRGELREAGEVVASSIAMLEKIVIENGNLAFDRYLCDAKAYLNDKLIMQTRPDGAFSQFTPEEQDVALLLTEGKEKREIARKMQISSEEVGRHISSIRMKVSGVADADPVIAAVAEVYKLSRREADVLQFLKQDAGNDAIANELYVSEETVRTHVRNLLKKLSIRNRQDVVAWIAEFETKHMR